jgi:hypothetical protein
MKKFLLVTVALVALIAPGHAELRDGVWAVENVNNCKVPTKLYFITMQNEHNPTRIRFENIATGSLDIEEVLAAGEHGMMTETVLSRRANGRGHDVGTRWTYFEVTNDLVNVERDGKTAYWIVKCDSKDQSENSHGAGIGFVNSSDLQCTGDRCVFYNKLGTTCASGWSIAVFDSPQGKFIGWLSASSGYPGSEDDKSLVYKRGRERSRDRFTYLSGIEGVSAKDSWSKLFTPRDNNAENLPLNQPACG